MEENKISKKEEYERRRAEKNRAENRADNKKIIKKIAFIAIILLIVSIGAFGIYRAAKKSVSSSPTNEIISRSGLHWHSELRIKILGKEQDVPANIGIGITHQPIHTHAPDHIIHMEFSGVVRKNDLALGRFFEIWGKQFNSECIFDKCASAENKLKMFVNAKENLEFENYQMKDGDKIEIIFEQSIK